MTSRRSDTVDYSTQCTVIISFHDHDREDRIVYERPQTQIPDGPLSTFDRIRISQFPTDDELTTEARMIFADMKRNAGRRLGAIVEIRDHGLRGGALGRRLSGFERCVLSHRAQLIALARQDNREACRIDSRRSRNA